MRALKYYVATSLDGYIAHEDGSFDGFPWDDEVVADFLESFDWFDTVLMGRKTYEVGLKEGKTSPYPMMEQIVFSQTMEQSPDEAVELVSTNAVERIRALKQESGKAIWLCGGGQLASVLCENGLIDEVIIKLNPVLFGSGIPLFSGDIGLVNLELTNHKIYSNGTILLFYSV
ncbi:MAG: dihydrofolate reductase family protein [Chloroflexota bacterium]